MRRKCYFSKSDATLFAGFSDNHFAVYTFLIYISLFFMLFLISHHIKCSLVHGHLFLIS